MRVKNNTTLTQGESCPKKGVQCRKAKIIFRIGLDFLGTILMTENKIKFEFLETLKILYCT